MAYVDPLVTASCVVMVVGLLVMARRVGSSVHAAVVVLVTIIADVALYPVFLGFLGGPGPGNEWYGLNQFFAMVFTVLFATAPVAALTHVGAHYLEKDADRRRAQTAPGSGGPRRSG